MNRILENRYNCSANVGFGFVNRWACSADNRGAKAFIHVGTRLPWGGEWRLQYIPVRTGTLCPGWNSDCLLRQLAKWSYTAERHIKSCVRDTFLLNGTSRKV
jgi:hypothetical protein